MKYYLAIALSCLLTSICSPPSHAKDEPIVVEIFTYSPSSSETCGSFVEDEFHNADGTHKEGISEHHHLVDKTHDIPLQNIEEVLTDLINEHADIIALQFNYDPNTYLRKDNKNKDFDKKNELNQLFNKRNYMYYKNSDLLDKHNRFQMVIGGKYKSMGTMKHIADSAINLYQTEKQASLIDMRIKEQQLEIEIPETLIEKEVPLTLVGYHQKKEIISNNPLIPDKDAINVVSHYETLKNWNGEERKETISISDINADGFALIAQNPDTAKIIAAGKVEKPTNQIQ